MASIKRYNRMATKIGIGCLLLIGLMAEASNPIALPVSQEQALAELKDVSLSVPVESVKRIPVQNRGRIKPLDTLARESLLFLAGKYRYEGLSAVQVYLGLIVSGSAMDLEIINVRDPELREKLGYSKSKRYFSIRQLETSTLGVIVRPLLPKQERNEKLLTPSEKNAIEAFHQLNFAKSLKEGSPFFESLVLVPPKEGETPLSFSPVFDKAQELLRSVLGRDRVKADFLAKDLKAELERLPVPELFQHTLKRVGMEVFYNQVRFFFWSGVLYLLIGVFFIGGFEVSSRFKYLKLAIGLPLLLHLAGFVFRVTITGFAPVTNMYGTMIWMSFGVVLFGTVLFVLYKNPRLYGFLLVGSAITLLLAEGIPLVLSPDMDPVVAVLRSNFWLTIHVLTVTISYAAFTIAMIIGNVGLVKSVANRGKPVPDSEYRSIAHMAYRAIQLGVFLLTAGIILGGWWADYSWGRFWGWDPKETWALIADLGFLAILHARFVGWLGHFGTLAAAPMAYLLVIMAWYGVNFILAAGLHSYGFSSGGALFVACFVGAQFLLFAVSILFGSGRFKAGAA